MAPEAEHCYDPTHRLLLFVISTSIIIRIAEEATKKQEKEAAAAKTKAEKMQKRKLMTSQAKQGQGCSTCGGGNYEW